MAQQWKLDAVAKLKDELKNYESFVFTDYRGMNVDQMSGLRSNLRQKQTRFHVVKNRYVKRVMKDLGHEGVDGFLVNPTALVYSNSDISEISKILMQAVKDTPLQLKGGFFEGSVLGPQDIEKVSKLPSKQALVAETLGMLNAPIAGYVYVLGGLLSKFLLTLKALEGKLEEGKLGEGKLPGTKAEETAAEETKAETPNG